MVQRRRIEHEFPPRPCPVDLLESQAFSRACEHARKVLPPAPKFLPGLPPLMPPPTVRLQPGPSDVYVNPHSDAVYGHQPGELNFWMPLTPYRPRCDAPDARPPSAGGTSVGRALGAGSRTTLWAESAAGAGDYHPLEVEPGQIAVFHGSLCRHHVPANPTRCTRASLDFRVGVDGCFDPEWVLRGTKADHNRREMWH